MTRTRRALATTLATLIGAGSAVALGAPTAVADASAVAITTVNIRSGPSTSTAVIGGLVRGQHIAVLSRSGSWAKVSFNRSTAYVAVQYLDLTGRGTESAPVVTAAGTKVTTATLNARTGPGLAYRVVDTIASGTALRLTGRLSKGFAETVVNGSARWVSAQYLASSTAAVQARTVSRRTTANLDVRVSASARARVVAEARKGSIVQTTGATEGGYAQVVFGGQIRWVTARYLANAATVFPAVDAPPTPAAGRKGEIALAFAKAQLGKRYVFGATGPNTFDCSGLVMRAWEKAGVQLPRVTTAQFKVGTRIARSQLRPGDLVFFYGSRPSHVGMYVGGDTIINAPRPGKSVEYTKISYMPYAGAVRPG